MKSFKALLVASYGRHYLARAIEGQADISPQALYQVTSRGKQHLGAVGDILEVQETGPEQAVIEKLLNVKIFCTAQMLIKANQLLVMLIRS